MRNVLAAIAVLMIAGAATATTYNVPTDFPTIQAAIDDAGTAAGDVIHVEPGTYVLAATVNVNKAVTVEGAGSSDTIIQVSGTGRRFSITAAGAVLQNMQIQKTDKTGEQNIIYIGASNVGIRNNLIWGQFVIGDGEVSRAVEIAYGMTGLVIEGNTIHHLRQPGYINGSLASPTTGNIMSNYVYATKGWVIAGANMTFTGNTWGTGADANVYDIAILSGTPASYYTDIPAISAANNNASIEDQRGSTPTLSVVYVDDSAAPGGTGTAASPCQTITAGITRVVAGGTIHVAAGTYAETIVAKKSMTLIGGGCAQTLWTAATATEIPLTIERDSTAPASLRVEMSGIKFQTQQNQLVYAEWNPTYAQTLTLDVHDNCFEHINTPWDLYAGQDFGVYVYGASQTARGTAGAIRIHDNAFSTHGGVLFENCRAVDVIENEFDVLAEGVIFNYYSVAATYGEHLVTGNDIHLTGATWDEGGLGLNNWFGTPGTYTVLRNVVEANAVYGDNVWWAVLYGVAASQSSAHDYALHNNSLGGDVVVWGDYAAAVLLDASANWWGATDAATVRAMANGGVGVDYTPWLAGGSATNPGFAGNFSTLYADGASLQTGTTGRIQEAIGLVSGSTVNVAAGTYDEPLNIESKTGLSILGADKATTILKSSTTLPWNVGGYGTSRQSMVRIVNSTGVALQNLTLDCDLIKGNNKFGISGWDSSVTLDNCIVQNMSAPDASGYYYELGSYFKAPGYTDTSRAAVSVTNCTFTNAGRVGVVTHDYINATFENNVFCKTIDDFGYGIEMGSQSTGIIRGNRFFGFDTPAASDGSESAGIYIENCFTSGVTSPVAKNVLVENNDIYGCQYGMWIGNGYNDYAGNVDIAVTLNNNNFHDNTAGGAWIQDEDRAAGSSVAVAGGGNTWANNGAYGMRVYTAGDGDITLNLSHELIQGNGTGVFVEQAGTLTGSVYNVSVSESSIKNNTSYGVNNTVAGVTVNAVNNWWGAADGPGPVGPGSGNKVSANVNYAPYMASDPGINILKLNVVGDPVYLQPGDTVMIDMDALNLAQHVLGCDAVLSFSSAYFVSTLSGPGSPIVAAGGGAWDQLIYSMWTGAGDLDVSVGVQLGAVVGTKADGTVATFTLTVKSPVSDGTTQMAFRADGDDNHTTKFVDGTAQQVLPGSKIASQTMVIDGTAPTIAIVGITPANAGTGGCALQGDVAIVVTASDPVAGLSGAPVVTVSDMTVGTAVEGPSGTFTCHATVGAGTSNGTHTVDAFVADRAGNVGNAAQQSFCINKNQIVAQVELQGFAGASRAVTFVATGGAGKTWAPMTLSFSTAKATCTLTDVPDNATGLSAKTAWSLRSKVALTGGADGQWAADLTGAAMLLGGDLNGTNSINVLDYGVLKINWFTPNAVADINGDGAVNTFDYGIMKSNWFQTGDEE